ncbi:MAG: VOC family protein [Planctomycetota bacterium]
MTTTTTISGLHLRLPAPDVRAAVAWYVQHLGFERNDRGDATYAEVVAGPVRIAFYRDDHAGEPGHEPIRAQFVLQVSDATALHARLRDDARAKVLWGPEVYPYGCREFSVQDPAGHHIIFSEPLDGAGGAQ